MKRWVGASRSTFRYHWSDYSQEAEFRQLGEECAKTAWCLLNSSDWKLEKSHEMQGDTVHSRYVGKKKLFKLQGVVNLPAKFLLEELFYRSESLPTWNPTITEYRTIQARGFKGQSTYTKWCKIMKNELRETAPTRDEGAYWFCLVYNSAWYWVRGLEDKWICFGWIMNNNQWLLMCWVTMVFFNNLFLVPKDYACLILSWNRQNFHNSWFAR